MPRSDARPFRWLVRVGFAARGLTYAVIGALALALAFGAGTDGKAANQQGALALIASAPLGFIALIVAALGLFAYAGWKFTQAIAGHGPEGGGDPGAVDRVGNFVGGIAYLAFAGVAIRILAGSGGSSSGPRRAASGVLGWPGGRWLVGAAGVALVAVSIYQAYQAVTGGFASDVKTEEMTPRERQTFMLLGRIGLAARGIVFAVVGYFLVRTAIVFNPHSAVGVDGALARLHHQAFGPWIVGFVGLGLLVFGVYSVFEGRYRRL